MTSGTPQIVDTQALAVQARELGAQWSLSGERELEANLVHIPAGEGIADHVGSVDMIVVVVTGDGTIHADGERYRLRAGLLMFVPRGSTRSFRAGMSGLAYLTVHRRREEGLAIGPAPTEG